MGTERLIPGGRLDETVTKRVVALLTEGPLCQDCLRERAAISSQDLARALSRIEQALEVRRFHPARCPGCDRVGPLLSYRPLPLG